MLALTFDPSRGAMDLILRSAREAAADLPCGPGPDTARPRPGIPRARRPDRPRGPAQDRHNWWHVGGLGTLPGNNFSPVAVILHGAGWPGPGGAGCAGPGC